MVVPLWYRIVVAEEIGETPWTCVGNNAGIQAKKTLKPWRDVRAYDAVDLEQWLEQSLPAQTWLMQELGQPTQNVRTLLGQLVGGDGAPDGADVF